MAYTAHRRKACDPLVPIAWRRSHLRSCFFHVAWKMAIPHPALAVQIADELAVDVAGEVPPARIDEVILWLERRRLDAGAGMAWGKVERALLPPAGATLLGDMVSTLVGDVFQSWATVVATMTDGRLMTPLDPLVLRFRQAGDLQIISENAELLVWRGAPLLLGEWEDAVDFTWLTRSVRRRVRGVVEVPGDGPGWGFAWTGEDGAPFAAVSLDFDGEGTVVTGARLAERIRTGVGPGR